MTSEHAFNQCRQLRDEIAELYERREQITTLRNQEIEAVSSEINTLRISLNQWSRIKECTEVSRHHAYGCLCNICKLKHTMRGCEDSRGIEQLCNG